MKIIAIDPGNKKSAYVIWDGSMPVREIDILDNYALREYLKCLGSEYCVVIEKVACMGMPVGEDVFETVYWTGRFCEAVEGRLAYFRVKRHEVKMHLCGSTRAKDANIITALVDRFDPERKFGKYGKGTIRAPGFFHGFKADVWQAAALAIYFYDEQHPCGGVGKRRENENFVVKHLNTIR